jgi:pilus assembly protein Flp/PilA
MCEPVTAGSSTPVSLAVPRLQTTEPRFSHPATGENVLPFTQQLVNFLKDEDGPTGVEYAVMLALIIVVCLTAITALGTNANNTFSYVGTKVSRTDS